MGVAGLWDAIAGCKEIHSLSPRSTQSGEPFKVAVDISIWIFQCAAASGGDNPVLRTFYYRLCRLVSANVRAIFVFDGPDRPKWKRGKCISGRCRDYSTYRTLIEHFGFLTWNAPGEAEAEAARLQSQGFVDAVLSDDVDALLFGATTVYRNWAAVDDTGRRSKKILNHTLLYSSQKIMQKCHLDVDGMILIALLAGGDYVPAGLSRCGIKTAVEIAKAGFGKSLVLEKDNLDSWRERLQKSLRTNYNGSFATRHPSLTVPPSFPDLKIYDHYVTPVVTEITDMRSRAQTLEWLVPINCHAILNFAADHLGWQGCEGGLKVVRTLAQPMLIGHLADRARDTQGHNACSNITIGYSSSHASSNELKVYGARQAADCERTSQLRIGYIPVQIVPLDLFQMSELSDPPAATSSSSSEFVEPVTEVLEDSSNPGQAPSANTSYDPHTESRAWITEALVKRAYPQLVVNWYASRKSMSPNKHKPKPVQALDKSTTLHSFGFSVSKVPVKARTEIQMSSSRNISGRKNALPRQSPSSPSSSTSELPSVPSDVIDLTESAVENTLEDQRVSSNPAASVNLKNCPTEREVDHKLDRTTPSTDPSAPSGTKKQGSIKSYFGMTKARSNDNLNGKTSVMLRAQTRGMVVTNEAKSPHKIVIRESLPGTWRFAEVQDSTHLQTSEIIDLS